MATKIKNITTDNGYILINYNEDNSITFFAELPEYAVIKAVKIDGEFLDDIGTKKIINYNRRRLDGSKREIATVYFDKNIPDKLFDKINSYKVQEFEVYYEEEAIIEV